MPSRQDVLRGEVLWEARRRKIEQEYSLALAISQGRRDMDMWLLRRLIVLTIDAGQRVDFEQLMTSGLRHA